MPSSKIIYALDHSTIYEAKQIVNLIKDDIGMLKVGMELFTGAGHDAFKLSYDVNLPVFLDLKLHDIPETIQKTVNNVSKLGAKILTVHAMGGESMLEYAVKTAQDAGDELSIACVTVLTSMDDDDLCKLCLPSFTAYLVRRYATMAYALGVRTFVCSPKELRQLRIEFGDDITLITPGIRLANSVSVDCQKRVATPTMAIANGANWLVIGRPIRNAENPVEVARAINFEIENAKPTVDEQRFVF